MCTLESRLHVGQALSYTLSSHHCCFGTHGGTCTAWYPVSTRGKTTPPSSWSPDVSSHLYATQPRVKGLPTRSHLHYPCSSDTASRLPLGMVGSPTMSQGLLQKGTLRTSIFPGPVTTLCWPRSRVLCVGVVCGAVTILSWYLIKQKRLTWRMTMMAGSSKQEKGGILERASGCPKIWQNSRRGNGHMQSKLRTWDGLPS